MLPLRTAALLIIALSLVGGSLPAEPEAPKAEPPAASGNQTPSDPSGMVTLTFSNGTQRIGHAAVNDVTVAYAAKGGHWLYFHISDEEVSLAQQIEFQKGSVQFGSSQWEHPGELYYNAELQAICFVPDSSDSRAYSFYNQEIENFSMLISNFEN